MLPLKTLTAITNLKRDYINEHIWISYIVKQKKNKKTL